MTGWNMPPGCNVSDIPGNSAADQAAEGLMDEVCAIITDVDFHRDDDATEAALIKLEHLLSRVWRDGYQQGVADEAIKLEPLLTRVWRDGHQQGVADEAKQARLAGGV